MALGKSGTLTIGLGLIIFLCELDGYRGRVADATFATRAPNCLGLHHQERS